MFNTKFSQMNLTPYLIEKYRRGECSPEEKAFVEHSLGIGRNTLPEYPFPAEIEEKQLKSELWKRLKEQIEEESGIAETEVSEVRKIPFFRRYGLYLTGIAACAVLVLGFIYLRQSKVSEQATVQVLLKKIVVPDGQKAAVKLLDGTKIQLNGGSTLEYPENFDDSIRLVRLSGEAFFEVAHDTTKPFVIRAPATSIRVLGTSFNLKAYEGEESRVSVVTGKVQFWLNSDPEKGLILTAGMVASAADKVKREAGEAATHLAWKENRLFFDNAPMSEVVKTLERHYGADLELRMADQGKMRLTGTFDAMALETMLQRLEYSLDIHYKKEGKKIIIY